MEQIQPQNISTDIEMPSQELQILTSAFAAAIVNKEVDKIFTPQMRAQLYLAVEKYFNVEQDGVNPDLGFEFTLAPKSGTGADIEVSVDMCDNATLLMDIGGGPDKLDLRVYLSCDASYHICDIKMAATNTGIIETTERDGGGGFRTFESADGMSGFGFRDDKNKKH